MNPHELVRMVCSGASHPCARIRSTIVAALSILGVLHIHGADAELFVCEQSSVVGRHVVLDRDSEEH